MFGDIPTLVEVPIREVVRTGQPNHQESHASPLVTPPYHHFPPPFNTTFAPSPSDPLIHHSSEHQSYIHQSSGYPFLSQQSRNWIFDDSCDPSLITINDVREIGINPFSLNQPQFKSGDKVMLHNQSYRYMTKPYESIMVGHFIVSRVE